MQSPSQHSVPHIRYTRKRQLGWILRRYITRWIVTVILLSLFVINAAIFDGMGTLVPLEKGYYNALIIVISLLVGMNITKALSSLASDLRWYILSLKSWHLPVAERILNIESLSSVIWLLCHKAGYQLKGFAIMWLFVSIGLQALIAGLAIGLGFRENYGYRSEPDTVLVGDLTEFGYFMTNRSLPLIEQQGLAQLYQLSGELFLGSAEKSTDFIESASNPAASAPDVFFSDDLRTFYHNFLNHNPDDPFIKLPSDRQISATTDCLMFNVLSGDGQSPETISVEMDDLTKSVELPAQPFGNTIYFTNFDDDCGPRCAQISVYKPQRAGNAEESDPSYFECTVEVSRVGNATQDFEQVSDEVAKIAAASAALDGTQRGDNAIQYQLYPENSIYDDNHGNATVVEAGLSMSAISSLKTLAAVSFKTTVGKRPFFGSAVDTKWTLVVTVMAIIAFIQLFIALLAAFFASKVVVVEDSIVSLSFIMGEVTRDIWLSKTDNYTRSRRKKEYGTHADHQYRYGFVKARNSSELDYYLTVKATAMPFQGNFPPGDYGIEEDSSQLQGPKEFNDGLKDSSSLGTTNMRERYGYGPDVMATP